jgi:hypothetical protein
MFTTLGVTLIMTAAAGGVATPTPRAESVRHVARATMVVRDSQRVADALRRAEAFAIVGRLADAEREYRSLISAERREGAYPVVAMWYLASTYYAADDFPAAARALDTMADAAQEVIDPVTELRARFEAAVLWSKLKERDRMLADLGRVKALLKSPAIPESQRDAVRRRIAE